MRYFAIVFVMSVFVIAYVWQNIEVMKTKMDYKRLIRTEQSLASKNVKLRYELEKMKNFDRFEANAGRMNLVKITPANLVVIKTGENKSGSKDGKDK